MAVTLTDLLIDLAEPSELSRFLADPEGFMSAYPLSAEEKDAIRSRDSRRIRQYAASVQPGTGGSKDHYLGTYNPALIEVEPMVEIMSHEVEQVADPDPQEGLLFVDKAGKLYKGVAQ